jgi:amino acid transporter
MSAYVFSIIPLLFVLQTASFVTDAFARDGALPKLFTKVDKKYQAPVATGETSTPFYPGCSGWFSLTHNDCSSYIVWLAALLALILALPSLGSEVAFAAATSIATIGSSHFYLPVLTLTS